MRYLSAVNRTMAFQIWYADKHVYLFLSEDFPYYLAESKKSGDDMYFIPGEDI